MLLTVVYGVYTVFFEGKGGTPEITAISATKELENLNSFITKVAEASKSGLSEEDKYIIELADGRRGTCAIRKEVGRAATGTPTRYRYSFKGVGHLAKPKK